MSSFDGVPMFNSGPHKIMIGGQQTAYREVAFSGVNGVLLINHGGRGWPVKINGILRANNKLALNSIMDTIETACHLWDEKILIDNWGVSHPNVNLMRFMPGFTRNTSIGLICKYEVIGKKVF